MVLLRPSLLLAMDPEIKLLNKERMHVYGYRAVVSPFSGLSS